MCLPVFASVCCLLSVLRSRLSILCALWPVVLCSVPCCPSPPPFPLDLSLALSFPPHLMTAEAAVPLTVRSRTVDWRIDHPRPEDTASHLIMSCPVTNQPVGRADRGGLTSLVWSRGLRTIAVFACCNLTSPRPVQQLPGPTFLPSIGVPDFKVAPARSLPSVTAGGACLDNGPIGGHLAQLCTCLPRLPTQSYFLFNQV